MTSDTDRQDHEPTEGEGRAAPFFVVGIGASAGGLEALSAFLKRVTLDKAAFVVVQHLAPNQTSMLTELLGRASRLAVVTAEEGRILAPNCVFVTPPNVTLTVERGALRLMSPAANPGHIPMPIDVCFRSLAAEYGKRAIGVVLSGTGTDGTSGLAAIKAAGGITFVQSPDTAKFDGMPRSALESGVADFCLPPEEIADEIFQIATHPYVREQLSPPDLEANLSRLSWLVKNSFDVDLMHYKRATIERRLQRRMAVHRLQRVADYLRLCQNDPKELIALHRDLLINVTSFFRDSESFDALKSDVLDPIVRHKGEGDAIRIWVPGCASGEEAYSVAICLLELLDARERPARVQLFGTDVDAEAIQQARRGIYPESVAADVSPDRLRRFFAKTDDGRYQVSRRLRDMVVFSTQNLTSDAPFSRLDLVTCRNLLIYLQSSIQRKVMRVLHYALVPDGFLMLGNSESVGESSDLFTLVDRKHKIYSAKHVALPQVLADVGVARSLPAPVEVAPSGNVRSLVSISHLADRKILDQFAPPGAVVNENLEIVYFRGRTAPYLEQPSGVVTHSILRLARHELHAALKRAIDGAFASGELTSIPGVVKDERGGFRSLMVLAQPLQEPETRARCVLILFKEMPAAPPSPDRPPPALAEDAEERVRNIEKELELNKEYLQSTIDELERTNEELKSSNEELQSSNEELQSTNEELETSKEELQSTNEELITLNEELQNRMRELSVANDDLNNLLLGVDRPVIIVGLDLRIRRFTQPAERLLNLIPGDVGRSLSQLNSFFGGAFGVEKRVGDAIAAVSTVEAEAQGTDERWYRVRIVPYKTVDLSIRGAVITLIDIDVRKRRLALGAAVDEYAARLLSAVPHPLLIVNESLIVIWANDVYYEVFAVLREEVVGTKLTALDRGRWSDRKLEESTRKTAKTGTPFRNLSLEADVPGKGRIALRAGGSRVLDVPDPAVLVLLSIEGDLLGGAQVA